MDEHYTPSETSLIYRHNRYRRLHKYNREVPHMPLGNALAKISIAMVIFFFIIYRSIIMSPEADVAGWSMKSNRDTKIYIQPNIITTKHNPLHICSGNKKAYLLIIVTSTVYHFKRRVAVRKSWGNYDNYVKMYKLYKEVKDKYKNYNYTYDLYSFPQYNNVTNQKKQKQTLRVKRGGYGSILPKLGHAFKDNIDNAKTEVLDEDKKIIDDDEQTVMDVKAFKLIFLLGMPTNNYSLIQDKIIEESKTYGDILQEDFIDSYNNLTLKSIMMLKWVVNNCKDSVRYILKADDDMFVNVPNLIDILKDKTKAFEQQHKRGEPENMLIGRLCVNCHPYLDRKSKWYSPRYMYSGEVYPKYLIIGYLLTLPTAEALYKAALRVKFFHLEDINITGFCAMMTSPRVYPRNEPNFLYYTSSIYEPCIVYSTVVTHKVAALGALVSEFSVTKSVDRCERFRLTYIRHSRMKIKRNEEE